MITKDMPEQKGETYERTTSLRNKLLVIMRIPVEGGGVNCKDFT